MNNLEIPEACIRKQHGYVLLDKSNRKAFRLLKGFPYKFLNSDFYLEKAGDYWPSILNFDNNKEGEFFKVDVDYLDHVFYWPEMAYEDVKKSLIFLCDISEYLLENNVYMVSHLWNIVIKRGKPFLIDIGDFKDGSDSIDKMAIFETITSTLEEKTNHHIPENFQPSVWIKNSEEILNKISKIKNDINSLTANKLVDELRETITKIQVNVNVHDWDDYPVQLNTPKNIESMQKHAEKNRPVLCRIIKINNSNSILDLGCSRGLYSLYASSLGAKSAGIDYSHSLISDANNKASALNLDASYAYIDLLDVKSWGLNGAYKNFIKRTKSDGVIAPALIHHLHGRGKSLESIISEWCDCSNHWIMIEYIPNDTLGNRIDGNKIIEILKEKGYNNIEVFNSKPDPRKWIYGSNKR